jgi:crossover junction endodeoxyribonuclease RuvC
MRILGIDPGSTATGFGVVERDGAAIRHRTHGTLRPPKTAELPERLAFLQAGLREVIAEYAPDSAVVERVFVARSAQSALVLGQARGAILAELGRAGLPVAELAAREIKRAVTGSGAADKRAVQTMVARLLELEALPAQDAADALAAALCHARQGPLAALGVRRRRATRPTAEPRSRRPQP